MPTKHSISFSELPEPFCNRDTRRPAYSTPIAQTQIGQTHQPSLKPQPIAHEQIKTNTPSRNEQQKANTPGRNVPNAPYPKPILKRTTGSTPVNNRPQIDPKPAISRPRVSLDIDSDRPSTSVPSDPPRGDADSEQPVDSDSDTVDEELILKPEGEAGRPGRGGYNLENALSWDRKQYRRIWAYVKNLADEHLDCSQSFSSQTLKSLQRVKNLALERFPVLLQYDNCWPIVDMLKLQLKYSSNRARLEGVRADAETEQLRRSYRRLKKTN